MIVLITLIALVAVGIVAYGFGKFTGYKAGQADLNGYWTPIVREAEAENVRLRNKIDKLQSKK